MPDLLSEPHSVCMTSLALLLTIHALFIFLPALTLIALIQGRAGRPDLQLAVRGPSVIPSALNGVQLVCIIPETLWSQSV